LQDIPLTEQAAEDINWLEAAKALDESVGFLFKNKPSGINLN
jgi:hypothetical protein